MSSLWKITEEKLLENSKKLDKEINADVCIIGGGITGISCAYYLGRVGLKAVILERDQLANRTTGNTTAKITSQHGLFYKYLTENYGKDFAKKYYNANQEAIKNIEQIINQENIECDFKRQDAYVFTQTAKEVKNIKDEVQAVKSFGGEAEFVEKIEPKLENIQGVIKFPNQAEFNPRKYLKGLVNVILENGGEIYEDSRVHVIKKDVNGYRVYTDEGYVMAKYVIIATNYPIINAPGFYFIKMYQETSYAIAVETQEKLFEGMYISAEEPRVSLRTAKYEDKDLLIVAGNDHRVGAKIDLKNSYNYLENIAKNMYADSKVLFKWNTQDSITLDKIPYIRTIFKFNEKCICSNRLQKMGNDHI